MRFMGLDLGEKNIGIAVSDELGIVASPRETLRRVGLKKDLARLTELAKEEGIDEFLVGLPLSMDGTDGPQARKARAFIDDLGRHSGFKVTAWDERLTTVAAERSLLAGNMSRARRKKVIDKVAAALILQSYLDYLSARTAAD